MSFGIKTKLINSPLLKRNLKQNRGNLEKFTIAKKESLYNERRVLRNCPPNTKLEFLQLWF